MPRAEPTTSAAEYLPDRLTLPALRGEPEEREANFAAFVDDLRVVADALNGS